MDLKIIAQSEQIKNKNKKQHTHTRKFQKPAHPFQDSKLKIELFEIFIRGNGASEVSNSAQKQ